MENIIKEQRHFFKTNKTLSYKFRLDALNKLKKSIIKYEDELYEAFIKDFNKSKFDVYTTEYSIVLSELNYQIKHLKKHMKSKHVGVSIVNFPAKGRIAPCPYGTALIMSPWNYPFQLSFSPLVGAIAAGNTAVVKPSNYTPNVSLIVKKILDVFDSKYITTVLGGREENTKLLDSHFDYIFFTGSTTVGRLVMEKASRNLTPISLELGGKSPCIVAKSADLKIAAKRIAWGKYLNAGQTCVAPDYVVCESSIKDKFIELLILEIKKFYYKEGVLDKEFPFIINKKHYDRLNGLIDKEKIVFGGESKDLIIEPTVLDNVTYNDPIMSMEIFGPILPILTYNDINDLKIRINSNPTPLALYIFNENKKEVKGVLQEIQFGDACVNDTIMHLTNDKLPFGGMGESGMGSYHGSESFKTFSHYKSILYKGKKEVNLKYPPHTEKSVKSIMKLMKLL